MTMCRQHFISIRCRLNLLIAVMGDSFERVKADEAAVAMFEQAEVRLLPRLLARPSLKSRSAENCGV